MHITTTYSTHHYVRAIMLYVVVGSVGGCGWGLASRYAPRRMLAAAVARDTQASEGGICIAGEIASPPSSYILCALIITIPT